MKVKKRLDVLLTERNLADSRSKAQAVIMSGLVYVDGEVIEEAYINEATQKKLDFIGPQTVPEGCVFVMGDNRNASTDSRDKRIGMVDERLIIGKVYMVIYPLSEFGVAK